MEPSRCARIDAESTFIERCPYRDFRLRRTFERGRGWTISLVPAPGGILGRQDHEIPDLYLLCRSLPLSELLERSADKFGHVRDFPLQALKGLADLSLTAGEPMPRLEAALDWGEVENWVRSEVRHLGRVATGLDPK